MFRLTFAEVQQHIDVSRETYDRLVIFHDLLEKWQNKINLISDATRGEIWERHILDSLQLAPLVPREARVLDIGSGAGFPGLMLAITGREVTMVERDTKKSVFLKEAARLTKTKTEIICASVEDIPPAPYDVITSRACASLDKLLQISSMFCHSGTHYLIHKGASHMEEVKSAQRHWQFTYKILPSITSPSGVILHVEHIHSLKTKTARHA